MTIDGTSSAMIMANKDVTNSQDIRLPTANDLMSWPALALDNR